jgi:hypothetical protein
MTHWRPGAVYTTAFLKKKGFSLQHLQKYRSGGWVESIGPGAIKRVGDAITWKSAVFALQQQMNLPITIGGKTALEIQGRAQYVKLRENSVNLYSLDGSKFPAWIRAYDWGVQLNLSSKKLFSIETDLEIRIKNSLQAHGLLIVDANELQLAASTPERAIIEFIESVSDVQSYTEAKDLIENLSNLRPAVLQDLLVRCKSIKAKRLFMHLAESVGHRWFRRLDASKLSLGSGKRQLIKNGELDSKWLITVPKT